MQGVSPTGELFGDTNKRVWKTSYSYWVKVPEESEKMGSVLRAMVKLTIIKS